MKLPFEKKLAELTKGSSIGTVLFWTALLIWGGVEHEFYSRVDPKVIGAVSPAPSLFVAATQWIALHPSSFAIAILAPFPILFILLLFAPEGPPMVEIISHRSGDVVDGKEQFSGISRKPKSSLQVFVEPAGSGKWYRQGDPIFDHRNWRVLCHFGTLQCPPGQSFTVVAVSGAKPTEKELLGLPKDGVRSTAVIVKRSSILGVEYEPGLYAGRTRKPLQAEYWVPYTDKQGRVTDLSGSVQFRGTFENGFQYPEKDGDLIPTRILGLRFKASGELNFYAHFRDIALYFSSKHAQAEMEERGREYRIPLSPSMLNQDWHTIFVYLPCLEQRIDRHLDVLKRISVRGNLLLSHVWCLERLGDLPMQYLYDAEDITLKL